MSITEKLKDIQQMVNAGTVSKDKHGAPMLQIGTKERVIYFADSKKFRVMTHKDFTDEEELVDFLKKVNAYKK